jgi:hypothetical protein
MKFMTKKTLVPEQVYRVTASVADLVAAFQKDSYVRVTGAMPSLLAHASEPVAADRVPPHATILVVDGTLHAERLARVLAPPPPAATIETGAQLRERLRWSPETYNEALTFGLPVDGKSLRPVSGTREAQTIPLHRRDKVDEWRARVAALAAAV